MMVTRRDVRRWGVFVVYLVGMLLLIGACALPPQYQPEMHPLYPALLQLQHERQPFVMSSPISESPALQAYLKFYGLEFAHVQHRWGVVTSGSYELMTHVFLPSHPVGTVFLLHGYLDHTGILRNLIDACLEDHRAVVVYDLPGHGLSSGERASIASFDEYTRSFDDVLRVCQPTLPAPYALISHSTGGAIALSYLAKHPNQRFERMIFLAPLVRYKHWYLSKLGYGLGTPIGIKTVPRRQPRELAAPEFLTLIKTDPLQTARVPLQWVRAVFDWNRAVQTLPPIASPALIIQGKQDDVVAWEYNIRFLQTKLPYADICWIDEAGHQLTNSVPSIRAEVFDTISAYLAASD
ncbi:hydrolase alpha/beta fold family protein [Candidatus Moduliflexus flocculans]|uniref:Hydrolase alpha/beta fold family protein n=1 Tax=Candidatus Moduliflexus flocculans TaxID=1499966 RepID=A0A0S6VTJ0_9BACT|nr:hydrolase alpha/beta fold family protein [Candidatus Moduliflexus flocculans]